MKTRYLLGLVTSCVYLACSDNPSTAGGWTGTENGIKATIVDSLGQPLDHGLLISTRVDQWVTATARQLPVPYDTIPIVDGHVQKSWNDTIPRLLRIVSGHLEYTILSGKESASLEQVRLSPTITVTGFVNSGFDAVHVLGTEQKDRVDGDNFYVISDVPVGLQVFLLRQGERLVFGGRINVFVGGLYSLYNLYACSDNPDFNGVDDYRGWSFPQLNPRDTVDAAQSSVVFNPGVESLNYTLNESIQGVIPANQDYKLNLGMDKNLLRLYSDSNQPACLEIWVK